MVVEDCNGAKRETANDGKRDEQRADQHNWMIRSWTAQPKNRRHAAKGSSIDGGDDFAGPQNRRMRDQKLSAQQRRHQRRCNLWDKPKDTEQKRCQATEKGAGKSSNRCAL